MGETLQKGILCGTAVGTNRGRLSLYTAAL
jgi:hypothetical protein